MTTPVNRSISMRVRNTFDRTLIYHIRNITLCCRWIQTATFCLPCTVTKQAYTSLINIRRLIEESHTDKRISFITDKLLNTLTVRVFVLVHLKDCSVF